MEVYTGYGDKGMTDLSHTKNVSKSDDRICLMGSVEELMSHIGLVRVLVDDVDVVRMLEKISETLKKITDGVSDPYNREFKVSEDRTELLEEEIDRLEGLFHCPKDSVLPGACPLSAQIDVTRSVARRAERALAAVSVKFGTDSGSKKYMNRLADYLYVLARYADASMSGKGLSGAADHEAPGTPLSSKEKAQPSGGVSSDSVDEAVIQAVLRRLGVSGRITLDGAKKLIEKIEQEALRRNKPSVIAVCTPDGNPVAVHVMDGSFLVSFDMAVKKAYTSVAVKMSTMELSALAQPGGTFYGVDKMDGGKIVIFGGGVPLKSGDTIIGGLGISGGTGEEDHSLAEYGLSVLPEILG